MRLVAKTGNLWSLWRILFKKILVLLKIPLLLPCPQFLTQITNHKTMGLNLNALKQVQENLNKRGSGDGLVVYQSALKEETDVRLLPPLPHMNGMYFIEVIKYWINGKPYVSPATFDKNCPIAEEVDEALASKDKDLKALLEDPDQFKKSSEFLMPALFLDVEWNEGEGKASAVTVIDEKGKILSTGPMLMKAINRVVTSRNFQNGTPDGIMDRKKGFNMILTKTGKKLDTQYDAQGWNYAMPMPEDFYGDKIPDVVAFAEKQLKSDEYLRGVIRNYLYGEPMPAEEKSGRDEEKPKSRGRNILSEEEEQENDNAQEEAEETPVVRRGASTGNKKAGTGTPAKRTPAKKNDTAEEEQPKAGGARRRNLADDLDNVD